MRNAGQLPASVKFAAHGRRYALSLQADGALLSLAVPDASGPIHMRIALAGANAGAGMKGEDELPGKVNYLIGNDRSRWRTAISTYRKVRYSEVYPGVDPCVIRMTFEGARSMRVDAEGDPARARCGRLAANDRPRTSIDHRSVRRVGGVSGVRGTAFAAQATPQRPIARSRSLNR